LIEALLHEVSGRDWTLKCGWGKFTKAKANPRTCERKGKLCGRSADSGSAGNFQRGSATMNLNKLMKQAQADASANGEAQTELEGKTVEVAARAEKSK